METRVASNAMLLEDLGGKWNQVLRLRREIKGAGFTKLSQQLQDSLRLFSTVDTVFLCNTSTSMR
jgi:hypothetical protein